MAEGTFEYECMRAELLGLPKPDKEEFLATQQEKLTKQSEEIEGKALEELECENDNLQNVSGGLDELNSILSITQKKINRFKNACGSLTNLLKIKVGQNESTESIPDDKNIEFPVEPEVSAQNGAQTSEIAKTLDKQVSKLDAMLEKAENAQYSMKYQNKQMKSLLK